MTPHFQTLKNQACRIVCEGCVMVWQRQGHTSKKIRLVEYANPCALLTFIHFSGNWVQAPRKVWLKRKAMLGFFKSSSQNKFPFTLFQSREDLRFYLLTSDRNPFAPSVFFLSFPLSALCCHWWIPCLFPQGAFPLPLFSVLFCLISLLQLCCVTVSTYWSLFKDCNYKHIKWTSQVLQMKRFIKYCKAPIKLLPQNFCHPF